VTARQARLVGLGERRPARIVTNDELARTLDTDDAWIRQRTGIATRRIAGKGESVVEMGADAARKALADGGIDPASVGLVVLATCSLGQALPGGAARIATAIGAGSAGAYDLNAACAGFCYALATAADAVRGGGVEHAVVVASERMSDIVDWTERSSAILFGDGAGAVVVGPAPADSQDAVVAPVVMGSDGDAAALIDMTPAGLLRLDGPAVYRYATTRMGDVARAVCEAAGIEPGELAAIVPHQANLRIVTAIARAVGAPHAVVADDVTECGNTSAASIPLALTRLRAQGRVARGDRALTLAFGAGFTWAGSVVNVP
jgi:3-oxoacyl-[acyl-carrier-protein] synthase III